MTLNHRKLHLVDDGTLKVGLLTLPLELLNHICSFFDGPAEAILLSSTCKTLRSEMSGRNGQLWFAYFNHYREVEAVVNKYKANYKEKDLKPLMECTPSHIVSSPLQLSFCCVSDQLPKAETTELISVMPEGSDKTANVSSDKSEKTKQTFFNTYTEIYDENVNYREKALNVLNGEHFDSAQRCTVCMIPSGLLPELWTINLQFSYKLGYKFITHNKFFCKYCIGIEILAFDRRSRLLGADISKADIASRPAIARANVRSCLETLNTVLDEPQLSDTPASPPGPNPVDFIKLINEDSVYGYFIEFTMGAHDDNLKCSTRPVAYLDLFSFSQLERFLAKQNRGSLSNSARKNSRIIENYKDSIHKISVGIYATLRRKNFVQKHKGLFSSSSIRRFLDREVNKAIRILDTMRPSGENKLKQGSLYQRLEPLRTILHVSSEDTNSVDQTTSCIFRLLSNPPDPKTTNGLELQNWIQTSIDNLMKKVFRCPTSLLSTSIKANFICEQIWKKSASKLSSRHSKKAGLCRYCDSDEDTYYTCYTYPIHLYFEHKEAFFRDEKFEWKTNKNGRGILNAKMIRNFTPKKRNSLPSMLFGPLCTWKQHNGKMEIEQWGYFDLV